MLQIYVPISNLDWMNYRLVKNELTFHHIKKKENGGKRIIENGALLMPYAHQYLHLIEFKDIETYETLNRIFKQINSHRKEATYGQRQMIEYILREFEEIHKNDRGHKGKKLIKDEYLNRGFYL